jgi:hypothetical protein
MAANQSRSMNGDFAQGSVDCTYIQLTPNRGNPENPPIERLDWPQYQNVEKWPESPFLEAHIRRAAHPREQWTSGDGDTRF